MSVFQAAGVSTLESMSDVVLYLNTDFVKVYLHFCVSISVCHVAAQGTYE